LGNNVTLRSIEENNKLLIHQQGKYESPLVNIIVKHVSSLKRDVEN